MSKLAWTPWHQVVQLREDIKSGELSMATFAADTGTLAIRGACLVCAGAGAAARTSPIDPNTTAVAHA